jgi:hypothetical protein
MNRQTAMGVGACALAILFLPAVASAKKTKFMKCGKPLPLQLKPFTRKPQQIDFRCRNSGCHKSAANDRQNAMKNNFCAPVNRIVPVTLKTFGDLGDASNNEPTIPKGEPPPSRAKLANILTLSDGTKLGEGKTVAFVGFVLEATHSNVDKNDPLTKGNGESVQCNLLGCAFNDIHITLAEDPNEASLCRTIVAEIIPHYRPAAWDLFDSPDYTAFLKTHPVKITGQLFFDGSHVPAPARGWLGSIPYTTLRISSGWPCGRFIRSTRSTFARTQTPHSAALRTRGFLSRICNRGSDSPA